MNSQERSRQKLFVCLPALLFINVAGVGQTVTRQPIIRSSIVSQCRGPSGLGCTATFVGTTEVRIPAAARSFGTSPFDVTCYRSGTVFDQIQTHVGEGRDSVIVLRFPSPESGFCVFVDRDVLGWGDDERSVSVRDFGAPATESLMITMRCRRQQHTFALTAGRSFIRLAFTGSTDIESMVVRTRTA